MNLENLRKEYYAHTAKASNVSRQAAFAGIALVWIFKVDSSEGVSLPVDLVWPSFFLVLTLAFDLLQYTYTSFVWGVFHRKKEKELGRGSDTDFGIPIWLNWPTNFFFWGKILSVITAYTLMTSHAVSLFKFA